MRELNSYYQLCNSTLELSPVPGASSDTSSSPRSSTTEDDLHDVTCHTEQGACNNSKPIYNFSIPDFIKHERQNVASSADNIPLNEAAGASANIQISRESKRRRDQRDEVEAIENQNQARADNRSNCRKKRRRTDQAANNHSPELIDLTDVTDHEDTSSVRDLDEIDPRPYLDSSIIIDTSRSQAGGQASGTTFSHAYESELERFRQRLRESRERIRREVAVVRDSRSRNRLSHQNTPCSEGQRIVSDGLAYTSQREVDLHSNVDQTVDSQRNYEYRPSEAPVINLEEDSHVGTRNRDREVTRMIFDESLYSPPYLTPLSARQAPSLETIEESIDRFEHSRRERERNMQRIRQQTQHRINEVRNRISRLGQQINNGDSNIGNGSFRIHISDSPQDNRHAEDEVEFLRELRPLHSNSNSNSSTQSAGPNENNSNSYTSNYNWNHLSRRRRFSNLFSNANITVPDFLFPYVHFISPSATQRLHHFPAPFLDDGEDYEALWNLAERLGPAKPRGLSKTEIDRLHAFRYSASKAEETNTSCVVCMSEYCLKEKIRKLPCTHDFHSKCIDKWLKSNKTCPVCRDEVKCA